MPQWSTVSDKHKRRDFSPKLKNFHNPCIYRLRCGGSPWNFVKAATLQKLGSFVSISESEKSLTICVRLLDTIPACDGRTDRQENAIIAIIISC